MKDLIYELRLWWCSLLLSWALDTLPLEHPRADDALEGFKSIGRALG